ncbi:MAG: hypothetical protein IPM27_11585 [Nitrosomonadales bacterium]|nr:hypothetical protein [Nitrosomonadales bacterium]
MLIGLLEAFWMLPTAQRDLHCAPDFVRPSRLRIWRTNFTHLLRLRYSRWLHRSLRHARKTLAIIVMLFALAVGSVVRGWSGPISSPSIRCACSTSAGLDMPPGTAVETPRCMKPSDWRSPSRKTPAPQKRAVCASYAGVKFTDTEPLCSDAWTDSCIAIAPRVGDMRDADVIVEAMRKEIESAR